MTETTRKDRRFLLTLSVVAILMAETRLFPTKIEALGVTFTSEHHRAILWLFLAAIVYQLISFFVHAVRDSLNGAMKAYWSLHGDQEEGLVKGYSRRNDLVIFDPDALDASLEEIDRRYRDFVGGYTKPADVLRTITFAWDYLLPVVLASLAGLDLTCAIWGKRTVLMFLTGRPA